MDTFEQEIYQLVQQHIANDKKSMDYYEGGKIGFDNMLRMKRENAENTAKILDYFRIYTMGVIPDDEEYLPAVD